MLARWEYMRVTYVSSTKTFPMPQTTRTFEEEPVDVVGLYMNPPARAVVFSFDEKTEDSMPGVGPHPAEPAHSS